MGLPITGDRPQSAGTVDRITGPNDPTISFSKATYKVNESRTETVRAEITLTRTGDLNKISTVYLEPLMGSATLGIDWRDSFRQITFNANENSKTFTIDILPDSQFEGTEKIPLRLANNADNANIGTLSFATVEILDAESRFIDTNVPISPKRLNSAIWGDYNNDGKLDILGNNQIYENTDRGFSESNRRDLPGSFSVWGDFKPGDNSAWGDYNNDGRLDVTVENTYNNSRAREVYTNTANGFELKATIPAVDNVFSYVTSVDYNNDGRLDILQTGFYNIPVDNNQLFRNSSLSNNNQDDFTNQNNFTFAPESGLGLPRSSTGLAAWGDYNNDGKLDVLLKVPDSSGRTTAKLYRNFGSGVFGFFSGFFSEDTGVQFPAFDNVSQTAWGDYDNDGKLDIAVSGWKGSFNYFTKIYRNKTIK